MKTEVTVLRPNPIKSN